MVSSIKYGSDTNYTLEKYIAGMKQANPDMSIEQIEASWDSFVEAQTREYSPEVQRQIEETRLKSSEQARRDAEIQKGKLGETFGGQMDESYSDRAKRIEEESKNESRKRMDSGDPLARLGGTQKSKDRVARNIDKQPQWIRDLAKVGVNISVDENGNYKPGLGQPDILDPNFNPKTNLDPTGDPGSIIYDPTTGEINLPGQKPLGRVGEGAKGITSPLIYNGKIPLGDLLDGYDYTMDNPFADNPMARQPVAGSVDDVLALQQQGNIQSFDSVNKGGSFEFQQAKGRPFGQPNPETAFLVSDTTSFGQVEDNKKGGTTFRWA